MTEAEAIKIVEKEKAYMDSHGGEAQSKALDMAITALEKQIPKKVLKAKERHKTDWGMYSLSDRWCPCCKGLVFSSDWSFYERRYMRGRPFCDCGQKLDWSEV